ncbi:hypothetical protein Droror1_Dr00025582 [Drosera rotundifolia]
MEVVKGLGSQAEGFKISGFDLVIAVETLGSEVWVFFGVCGATVDEGRCFMEFLWWPAVGWDESSGSDLEGDGRESELALCSCCSRMNIEWVLDFWGLCRGQAMDSDCRGFNVEVNYIEDPVANYLPAMFVVLGLRSWNSSDTGLLKLIFCSQCVMVLVSLIVLGVDKLKRSWSFRKRSEGK